MIKIYGMPTCPYCDYVHEQIKDRKDEFEYIDIGENIRNMGAFTRLRDTNPIFDHCRRSQKREKRLLNMKLREIEESDNRIIAGIIRANLKAVGLDIPGTAYYDESLDNLSKYYLCDQ